MSLTGEAEQRKRAARPFLLFFFGVFTLFGVAGCAVVVGSAIMQAVRAGPLGTIFTSKLLVGLVPALFAAVGLAGLRWAVRMGRLGAAEPSPRPPLARARPRGRVVIKPAITPRGRLVGCLLFALIWNGILAIPTASIFMEKEALGEVLFLIPFLLVGLGSLAAVVYFFLALFNPRPHLTMTPAAVPLGANARVEWELVGNTRRVRLLIVTLVGREEAQYRRGTDTVTSKSTFFRAEVARGDKYGGIGRGSGTVRIPADLMHSFASPNNKIIWELNLHGEIPMWPDVDEDFPVEVLPREAAASEPAG